MFNSIKRWFKGYRRIGGGGRGTPRYTPHIPDKSRANYINQVLEDIVEPDPIVATVIKRMLDRSKIGMEKYGCTMMREDLKAPEWIDHTIEELLDAAVYLERLKVDLHNYPPNMNP